MRLIEKLIALALAIAELVKRYRKAKEQKHYEEQHEKLQENPAQWWQDHFNGKSSAANTDDDHSNSLHDTTELPRDAERTGKTEPTQSSVDPRGRDYD